MDQKGDANAAHVLHRLPSQQHMQLVAICKLKMLKDVLKVTVSQSEHAWTANHGVKIAPDDSGAGSPTHLSTLANLLHLQQQIG